MRTYLFVVPFLVFSSNGASALAQEGSVQRVSVQHDPSRVSSPGIGGSLYACANTVTVTDTVRGALARVYVNGRVEGEELARDNTVVVALNTPLVEGWVVTATHEVDGIESEFAEVVVVEDHRYTYPDGLQVPRVQPPLIYECGYAIGARGQIQGSTVHGFHNGVPSLPGVPGSENGNVLWITTTPFDLDDAFEVQYGLCDAWSAVSKTERAVARPAELLAPTLHPTDIYEGQEVVTVRGALNGAMIEVDVNGAYAGSSPTASGSASIAIAESWNWGRPLAVGDVVSVRQRLCDASPSAVGAIALQCSELPAPKIRPPIFGDTVVTVTNALPAARITLFDQEGVEIGDGGSPTIRLYRPLAPGDVVTVVQTVGACAGTFGYVIPARCSAYDTVGDRSLSGPYAVAAFDYDSGTVTINERQVRVVATVRYPVLTGETSPIPFGPPLPLVIIQHGNHGTVRTAEDGDKCPGSRVVGTEAPSFRGFDYLLDALASWGYIAVSMNANDLNCLPGPDIAGRAQLFGTHIALWEHAHSSVLHEFPTSFVGRVDLDRTVVVGHSQGGEAAILSGAGVLGVVAIAPTDIEEAWLIGTPFLSVVPANDLDVVDLSGIKQYDRARAVNGSFKALAYMHDANHNFFNSEWLHDDCAANAPFMAAPTQQAILRGVVVEFVEALVGADRSKFAELATDNVRLDVAADKVQWTFHSGQEAYIDAYGSDENPFVNSLGGQVNEAGFTHFFEASLQYADVGAILRACVHWTYGLLAAWHREGVFTSDIPSTAELFAQDFDELFIRAAQVAGVSAAFDLYDHLPASVSLLDLEGEGETVSLSESQHNIPRPFRRDAYHDNCPISPTQYPRERTVLKMLRIPLTCFDSDGLPPLDQVNVTLGGAGSGFVAIGEIGLGRRPRLGAGGGP